MGPRAVDPAGATAVWAELSEADPTRATDGLARRFGAGLTLTGSVVADPSGLNVSASLSEVSSTSDLASTSVQGPADSLAAIVDRLAAGLLSLSTGEYEESLDQLTSTSPEALREYLLGNESTRECGSPFPPNTFVELSSSIRPSHLRRSAGLMRPGMGSP